MQRRRSTAWEVANFLPPGWMTEICTFALAVVDAGAFGVRRVMEAAVLINAVSSKFSGLAQPGS